MTANNETETTIVNYALSSHLGEGRIMSLNDAKEQAIVMNLHYNHTRKMCLNILHWQFARKRKSIPALFEAPEFEYAYQYQLPSDFLKLYQVGDYYPAYNNSLVVNSNTAYYTLEGNKILTNAEAPLNIKYTADIVDTTQFSPLFTEFFSLQLAIASCEPITQSNTKKKELILQSDKVLKMACLSDKTQYPPQQHPNGGFLDARIR